MSKRISESDLEELFLDLLSKTGYSVKFGPDISPGGPNKEREYSEVVLRDRLIQRLQIMEIDGKMIERERTKRQNDILKAIQSITCT